jgi:hypothetical protein
MEGVTDKEDAEGVYPKSPLRPPPKNMSRPNPKGAGKDAIYVGYGKE